MRTESKIIVIDWFNHYDDVHLKGEYEDLEKIFEQNEDKIKCLFDCEHCAVFRYDDSVHQQLFKLTGGLFEPEYYPSLQDYKDEYYEYESEDASKVSDEEFFGNLEYQKQLGKIMHESGGDEREFDRLWCEEFVH